MLQSVVGLIVLDASIAVFSKSVMCALGIGDTDGAKAAMARPTRTPGFFGVAAFSVTRFLA